MLESLTPDEWSALAHVAIRQRVGGVLTFGDLPWMPVATRQVLEARARTSAIRVLRYQAEFVRLARAVESAGVELLVLKGLHLATSVYPHAAMREMNDIDVLVRLEHLDAVAAAARELGYVPMHGGDPQAIVRVRHHLPRFLKPGAGLEIHWRLTPEGQPPLADPAELWGRARPNTLAGNTFTLCPEDALLHICAHATVLHFFELGIRPLCDIRAIVTKHGAQIHWETVASRAADWHCERGVTLALRLAQHLLGVEIPRVIFDRLAAAMPSEEVVALAADLLFSEHVPAGVGEPMGRLMAVQSLSGRLRYAWSRVVLSSDHLAVMYPNPAHGHSVIRALIPMRRLWDLTRRHSMTLVRLALYRHSEERNFIDRRNALAAWLRQP